jgi:hypothetical protein
VVGLRDKDTSLLATGEPRAPGGRHGRGDLHPNIEQSSGCRLMTDAERSLLGRLAAESSWANTEDRSARTAPARAAFEAKFLEQADGDPVRAAHLRKAFYARLALKSARARRARP